MKLSKRLQHFAALLICAAMLIVPALEGRNKKGDKLFKEGQKDEEQKHYDAAVNYYDQALATDPKDPGYILADQRARNKAAEIHVAKARSCNSSKNSMRRLSNSKRRFWLIRLPRLRCRKFSRRRS